MTTDFCRDPASIGLDDPPVPVPMQAGRGDAGRDSGAGPECCPGEPAHIAHRVDRARPMIQKPAMKSIAADLVGGFILRKQIDRRAETLPFLRPPRQVRVAFGRMGGVDRARFRQLAADLVPFDQRHDIAGRVAEDLDEAGAWHLAQFRP